MNLYALGFASGKVIGTTYCVHVWCYHSNDRSATIGWVENFFKVSTGYFLSIYWA